MVLARGFTLIESVVSLAFLALVLGAGLGLFQQNLGEQVGWRTHAGLWLRLCHLRQVAVYSGYGQALTEADFSSGRGITWRQKPLLGFAVTGYPSEAGTVEFYTQKQSRKLVVQPASGSIKYEATRF